MLVTGNSSIHGLGLFTTTPLRAGTFLGEYVGRSERWHPGKYIGHYTMRIDHPDGRVELRNATTLSKKRVRGRPRTPFVFR